MSARIFNRCNAILKGSSVSAGGYCNSDYLGFDEFYEVGKQLPPTLQGVIDRIREPLLIAFQTDVAERFGLQNDFVSGDEAFLTIHHLRHEIREARETRNSVYIEPAGKVDNRPEWRKLHDAPALRR